MTEPTREDGAPWRNFYGRRHGKTLRSGQRRHMETTLREIAPSGVTWEENPDRQQIDPAALFGDGRPLWLEIGFGGGEHMLAQAAAHRDVGIIGCEPYVNGVAMFLAQMAREKIDNIRVHAGDVRDLLDVLPAASMDRAFLLYPDPWPKKRHHRRRFVNPEFIDPLARVLKPGAIFRVATDIPDYVRHTLEHLCGRDDFEWLAERPSDWRAPWPDWHRTRYEAKAIRENRVPHYLTFRRL
ncbi:tRNA (guanosine(46)-N7)-methyltransferase TrmB [Paroceanicella profunda]|uniref:tRNA (guanine-N(7)-)-methyltransferase n=1 Tax=Paroceanicella profunda TaxID=2579971 RepID=A0A5B8FZB6_9RHOB|nr:tRNA (guanosine(46)-N7)-methyltransferase TrmB [Paroceanicella profunda]QDL91583.1 tRNA (guanosine(46)-N7)-methyltransferase TrmB [Paroceanicella profunda]